MSGGRLYDRHYLFLETGSATSEQVERSLRAAMAFLGKTCSFRVNVVTTKGSPKGDTYAYFSDLAVANAILGKNPDGTDRVEEKRQDGWKPPDKDFEVAIDDIFEQCKEAGCVDWGDFSEIEDEIRGAYIPTVIRESLPTLAPLPPVDLSKEQQEALPSVPEYRGPVTSTLEIKSSPAYCYAPPRGSIPNVLVANIPPWLTAGRVKTIFEIYSSDKKFPKVETRNVMGRKIVEVSFARSGNEASFALLMTRKVVVKEKNQETILYFDYAKVPRKK